MFVKRNPIRDIVVAGKISSPSSSVNVSVSHISIGSYYEIEHTVLPLSSPEQLKSIRIVIVSNITGSDVTVRYPSMYSLRSHFNGGEMSRSKQKKKRRSGGSLVPVFDESHVMTSELAGDLLYRRIEPHEVSVNRNSWSFWISRRSREMVSQPAYNTRLSHATSKVDGECWSELRSRGMIKWGKRIRVHYQNQHKEEDSKLKEQVCKEEEDDDDGNVNGSRKRKLIESKTHQSQKKENQIVVYRRRSERKFIDRWSVER